MADRQPPSGPDRDRQLARQPRYAYRDAKPLAGVVASIMSSEDMQRMRRFQRVAGVLKQILQPAIMAKLKPVHFAGGVLTIEVVDGPLLAELRQHHAHRLLAELARAGTGVSRVQWRLRAASRPA